MRTPFALGPAAFAVIVGASSLSAHATVKTFTSFVKWQSAAGSITTIPFTGFPDGTIITSQYGPLGVKFLDGDARILLSTFFTQDGAGLYHELSMSMSFSPPLRSIAVHYPGIVQFSIITADHQTYLSPVFIGPGNFVGFVSTVPITTVHIVDPFGYQANIDNLYFGSPPHPHPELGKGRALATGATETVSRPLNAAPRRQGRRRLSRGVR